MFEVDDFGPVVLVLDDCIQVLLGYLIMSEHLDLYLFLTGFFAGFLQTLHYSIQLGIHLVVGNQLKLYYDSQRGEYHGQ